MYPLEQLRNELNRLQLKPKNVTHIAGSKGKGSTAHLLALLLERRGLKVGLFTSPFLTDPREMIQVNHELVSAEDFDTAMDKVDKNLSEFERWTLAALLIFQNQSCDHVILECGWGGSRDATNVVEKKRLTILTHVELEHLGILGHNLEEIALEKLGICRAGLPLITLASQAPDVFKAIESRGMKCIFASEMELGWHHPDNVGLAVAAFENLGFAVRPEDAVALANFQIPGRFEIKKVGIHTLILDGAHTYDSLHFTQEQALRYARENGLEEPCYAVHILNDKPRDLLNLFPKNRRTWIQLEDPRASQKPEDWAEESAEDFLQNIGKITVPTLFVATGSFRLVNAFHRLV
jgi:folylpolyglutamate synthase/dihydropteroate synthase